MANLYKCTVSALGLCQMAYSGKWEKCFILYDGSERNPDDIILTSEQLQQILATKIDKSDNSVNIYARFSKTLSDMTEQALVTLQLDTPSIEDEFELEL